MPYEVRRTEPEIVPEDTSSGTDGWMCVIYDNEYNTLDEVVVILMAATGCCYEEAYCEMWEAHTFGKANCHYGSEAECRRVADTISAIGVRTEVCKEWE
jgi:ATP-dependent Clp protease adaptor protein ClpS